MSVNKLLLLLFLILLSEKFDTSFNFDTFLVIIVVIQLKLISAGF